MPMDTYMIFNIIKKKIKTSTVILITCLVVLASAYILEFFFGFEPCPLCLKQRIPYFIVIGLLFVNYILHRVNIKKFDLFFIFLSSITMAYSSYLALYHVGVEFNFWEITSSCSPNKIKVNQEIITNDLLESLVKYKNIDCSKPQKILGLSLATYNFFISIFIVILSLPILLHSKYFQKNKKIHKNLY
jgi:disulfide bond formation protein DsbB